MMKPGREFLERASAETGYQPQVLEKIVLLGDLAEDLSRHPLLKGNLLLKGGTALNLGSGTPGRLSVDLDYNYCASPYREKMLHDRPVYEAAVMEIAARKGFQVQQSADSFAGRKIFCRYQSWSGTAERIELDLNYLYRQPVGEPETRTLWQPGGYRKPALLMVSTDELIIGKLLALLDRAAVRDLWDVGSLPDRFPGCFHSPLFRARFITMSAVLDRPLMEYTVDRIHDRISARSVSADLDPMLRIQDRSSITEIFRRADEVLYDLLALTVTEREYILGVSAGELNPAPLFPGNEAEAELLRKHPALQWKMRNVSRRS